MEIPSIPERPSDEFVIETGPHPELRKVDANPEAFRGCLVEAMREANCGSDGARNAVGTTVVESRGRDFAMVCGRCGITMVQDNGTVYGARKCPKVQSGTITLSELA